ncbi:MAG: helix-turn-helix domain-containing protein [Oscillospiraceae bacterium]|nr:helix-turn-helix domain-containing protein [Oscillospiraceae bacterium]
MSLINNILDILKDKHKKQSELCTYLGINTSTMTNWKNRDTDPPAKYIIPICEFLSISPYYLLTGKEKSPSLPNDEQELLSYYKKLPEREKQRLIGRASALAELYEEQVIVENRVNTISLHCSDNRVSAGIGDELYDYEQWDTIDIVETKESRKADFMLKVDGSSMEPKFYDGDYVLIRQQPAVDIGQIGIFDVDGKGYIKKFDGDKLISLNPDYDDISLVNREFRCFGLVLGTAELI